MPGSGISREVTRKRRSTHCVLVALPQKMSEVIEHGAQELGAGRECFDGEAGRAQQAIEGPANGLFIVYDCD